MKANRIPRYSTGRIKHERLVELNKMKVVYFKSRLSSICNDMYFKYEKLRKIVERILNNDGYRGKFDGHKLKLAYRAYEKFKEAIK